MTPQARDAEMARLREEIRRYRQAQEQITEESVASLSGVDLAAILKEVFDVRRKGREREHVVL